MEQIIKRVYQQKPHNVPIKKFGKEDQLRFKEHRVALSNQTIVEMAYLTKEMIEPLIKSREKLFFEQANCYLACFYKCRKLLKLVDQEYLLNEIHKNMVDFYKDGRELSNDWDRLSWEKSEPLTGQWPRRMRR